jgi:hypothetical protein
MVAMPRRLSAHEPMASLRSICGRATCELGGERPRRVRGPGPYDGGEGLAASRHENSEPQDEEPMKRGVGQSRLRHGQYWHCRSWDLHPLSPSWWRLAVCPLVEDEGLMKGRLFPAQTAQKSS